MQRERERERERVGGNRVALRGERKREKQRRRAGGERAGRRQRRKGENATERAREITLLINSRGKKRNKKRKLIKINKGNKLTHSECRSDAEVSKRVRSPKGNRDHKSLTSRGSRRKMRKRRRRT